MKLLIAIKNKDVDFLKLCLNDLIELLNKIQLSIEKEKFEDWNNKKLKYFLIKFTLHVKSFSKISDINLVNPNDINRRFLDISSSFLIVRAIIENYLTIFYLYILPKNEEEFEFFHHLYISASMIRRQDLKKNYEDKFEPPSYNKVIEEKMIKELIEKLKHLDPFKEMSKEKRKNIESMSSTNMKAMIYNWNELIEKSNLRNEIFKNTWRLASSYAHSEELALIQLKDYYENDKGMINQNNFLASMVNLNCMLTSLIILFLKNKFDFANKIFQSLDKDKMVEIEIWNALAIKQKISH